MRVSRLRSDDPRRPPPVLQLESGLNSVRGGARVKKWIYLSILVSAALALAVGGWIVQAVRAAARPSRRPVPGTA
jgi:hypothetical protein